MKHLLILFALLSACAATEREHRHTDQNYEEHIHKLEMAMGVLEEVGHEGGMEALHDAANRLREQRQRARRAGEREGEHSEEVNSERQWAMDEIEAMRLAEKAWAEAGRKDSAELCRRAYRSMEMRLEGRSAERVRRETGAAVQRGAKVELLLGAARLYREWEMPDRSEITESMGRRLQEAYRRRQARAQEGRARAGRRRETDRQQLQRHLAVLRMAKAVFRAADNEKLVGLVERSMHARELMLSGRRDEEARHIMGRRPSRGNEVEILQYASGLLRERGRGEQAQATAQLAEEIARNHRERSRGERDGEHGDRERAREGHERERERGREEREHGRERGEREGERGERERAAVPLEEMQERLQKMARMLEEMRRELERLRARGRRR